MAKLIVSEKLHKLGILGTFLLLSGAIPDANSSSNTELYSADIKNTAIQINVALPPAGYPPYILINQGKPHHGIMVEVLREAADLEGIELNFELLSEKESHLALEEGVIDARIESPFFIDNPKDYLWSEEIAAIHDVFIFNRKTENRFEDDTKLAGAKVVTHIGYGYPTLEEKFQSGVIKRVDRATEADMLDELLIYQASSTKVAVIDKHVARWIIKITPKYKSKFDFSKRVIGSAPYMFQFRNTAKLNRTLERLNKRIIELKKTGFVKYVARRLFKQD